MTFVTAERNKPARAFGRSLIGGVQFGFEGLQIRNDGAAAFELEQAFHLQAGEIAGDQLADGAELRGQFLVAAGQRNSTPAADAVPSRCAYRNRKDIRR